MTFINKIMTAIFDFIFMPFNNISPIWGLLVVSLLTGIVMIWIFKFTSNQAAIKKTKDKISAHFMEVRLFKDDLGIMLDAQKKILRTNLTYMRYSVTPMLVMIVPVVLILVQLGIRYAARPLRVGDSALVKVTLATDAPSKPPLLIELGDGLKQETPMLRAPGGKGAEFRVGAVEEGEHEITVLVGEERVTQPVLVSSAIHRVYPTRAKATFMHTLLNPGQVSIPKDSSVEEISVSLPPQDVKLLGFNINWLVFFFVASVVGGYSLKGVFKVEV